MWATLKKEEQKAVTAQKAMERSMLRISLREYIGSEVIWERGGVKDMITTYRNQKLTRVNRNMGRQNYQASKDNIEKKGQIRMKGHCG